MSDDYTRVAFLAHEIKNPLAIIKANLQLIELDMDKSLKKRFDIMYNEIDKINDILKDFMNNPQATVYKFEKVSLMLVIDEAVKRTEASFKAKKIILIKSRILDDMYVKGDKEKLIQVVINIFKNAVEAMHTGGKITVSVFKSDSYISIKIEDNGSGIPEDYIDKIGSPFFTTKEGGNGLGLSVSKKIIADHNGVLAISSTHKIGSSISITLPEYKN